MKRAILAALGAFIVLGVVISAVQVKGVLVPTKEEFDALVERVVALEEAVFPSPSPSPSPSPEPTTTTEPPAPTCKGMQVTAGANLTATFAAEPAGTTFCLQAGTYTVAQPVIVQAGDRVLGAGRDLTLVDGSGLANSAPGIFDIGGDAYFEQLDVSGAPTPAGGVTGVCSPNANCGKAFVLGGQGTLTLQSVDCHDNGGNCVGGGGAANLVADDLDCYANGNAYSITKEFRYAACIKRAAIYVAGGNTTITRSFIHDNLWVGVWCDFCYYGAFAITDSALVRNGKAAVSYEVSGGETAFDSGLIARNVIQDNGDAGNPNRVSNINPTAISCNSCAELTIEGNTFGGNVNALLTQNQRRGSWGDIFGVVVRNNVLAGDVVNCSAVGVSCSGNA